MVNDNDDLFGVTLKALAIAMKIHEGQTERSGKPYLNHPQAVADIVFSDPRMPRMEGKELGEAIAVALLHDTLEDSDYDAADDIFLDIPMAVMGDVMTLTHPDLATYDQYINIIIESNSKVAMSVKLADLIHNMDVTRLPEITPGDLERLEKYHNAYRKIRKALDTLAEKEYTTDS